MHANSSVGGAISRLQPFDLLKDVEDRVAASLQRETGLTSGRGPSARRASLHHMASKGQRVRTRLALHAGLALGLAADDAVTIATAVELLHNASLIHDDIQDRDKLRRGRESVWAAFGEDVAICAGDLLLSSAYAALSAFSTPAKLPTLISLTHSRTALAIAGQCDDLGARRRRSIGISEYEQIVVAKSGALLGLPLELALVASDNATSCPLARHAAESFAIGYQIVDDIEDRDADARTPGSLNMIEVLREAGHCDDTLGLARSLGLKHLSNAATAALVLPERCGDLLREYALRVSAQL